MSEVRDPRRLLHVAIAGALVLGMILEGGLAWSCWEKASKGHELIWWDDLIWPALLIATVTGLPAALLWWWDPGRGDGDRSGDAALASRLDELRQRGELDQERAQRARETLLRPDDPAPGR